MNTFKHIILSTLRTFSLSLVAMCVLIGNAFAENQTFELRPFDAVYSVKKSGLSLGKAYFKLKDMGDNHWEYSSYIKPSGMATLFSSDRIKESSVVEKIGDTIRPVEYNYTRTGKKSEKASITFNWDARTATVTFDGKVSSHTLSGREQDHYSLVLNLMRMGSLGIASQTMTVINDDVKEYTYTSKGAEQVRTAVQKFNAIKMVQTSNSSRSLHYWLSPQVNFLPVKIEQHKKGKKNLEMTLKSLEFK